MNIRFALQHELPKRFQDKVKAIIAAQKDPKFKEFVSCKLKYSEPGLKKRIADILSDCPESVLDKIGDKKEFINETYEARNYLTHYVTCGKAKKIAEPKDLLEFQ